MIVQVGGARCGGVQSPANPNGCDQAIMLCTNAHVDQLAVLREDRNLIFPLPQIHAHMVHR
jgi:hypothetical protein